MAQSSSIKRAQVIKLCEFCEEESIKWRCIDCDQCICDKCRNIHLKARGTNNHQVVTITSPLKDIQRRVITDNIPCQDHKTKMMCLFCKTCECLVCPDCVASHTKHHFVPIDSVLNEKLDHLKSVQYNITDKIKECEAKHLEIEKFTPKYNSVYKESVAKIKRREQELIDTISKYSKLLQNKVEVERSKIEETVSKIEKEISQTKRNLEDLKDEVETTLVTNQGGAILETTVKLPKLKFDPLPNAGKHFISTGEITEQMQELFGWLQDYPIHTEQTNIDFEVTRTYTTDLNCIKKIIAIDETSAWISSNNAFRKVKITDKKIETLQEISLNSCDMTMTNNKDILVTLNDEKSDIKVLTKSGEIKHFMSVAPLIPRAIHVTKDNDVVVGVREHGDPYQPTEKSQRAVIQFSMDCKEKHRYQYDGNRQRLFTFPWRITTNIYGDILIIDGTSHTTGRVGCYARGWDLKWIYKGHQKINSNVEFDPQGIIATSAGHIIVSDYGTNVLHVLSGKGDVLLCKGFKGMEHPWGLDIEKEGLLWVGSSYYMTGKLHILKLKEWS